MEDKIHQLLRFVLYKSHHRLQYSHFTLPIYETVRGVNNPSFNKEEIYLFHFALYKSAQSRLFLPDWV